MGQQQDHPEYMVIFLSSFQALVLLVMLEDQKQEKLVYLKSPAC